MAGCGTGVEGLGVVDADAGVATTTWEGCHSLFSAHHVIAIIPPLSEINTQRKANDHEEV